ncbi:MAG: DUF3794 domain-containing protein [Clostridia bacterium]|nr:DUF3794 domain-containing protein [Clostridia bacterium]
MDLQVTHQGICINETVYNQCVEQAIDCEFTLPDYCPDIERILKCSVTAKISSTSAMGSSITVDGTAFVNVLYCSDKGELRGYEVPIGFSKSVDAKGDCEKAFIKVTAKPDYINCRAVNERKLDVHGAVSVCIKATKSKDADVVTDTLGDNVYTRKSNTHISEMIGCANKQVVINEEIELGQSNGSIMNMIRYDAKSVFEECKMITNKAIIKGVLNISVLYCSDEKRYEKLQTSIPINQILELEGCSDESDAVVQMDVCSCELKPYTNTDGDCRSIMATVKINISVCAYDQNGVDIVTDAYSTVCELDFERQDAVLERKVCDITTDYTAKNNLQLPGDSVADIIDIWCTTQNVSDYFENDEIIITGDVLYSMITINTDNECMYYERVAPFEYRQRVGDEKNIDCDVEIKITGCSYNIISSDSVDVRCEMSIMGKAVQRFKKGVIANIIPDESRMKSVKMPALVVYYADRGDSVWDIAMKYNTSVEMIMEQNSLTADVLQSDKMLLIPSV